jgi:hypothetical protein
MSSGTAARTARNTSSGNRIRASSCRHSHRCGGSSAATGTGAADTHAPHAPRPPRTPRPPRAPPPHRTPRQPRRCRPPHLARDRPAVQIGHRRGATHSQASARQDRPPSQGAAVLALRPAWAKLDAMAPAPILRTAAIDPGEGRHLRIVPQPRAARRDPALAGHPVASTTTRPAPPCTKPPRCTMCQSDGTPSVAWYWHIGATATRFGQGQAPQGDGRKQAAGHGLRLHIPIDRGFRAAYEHLCASLTTPPRARQAKRTSP